MLSTTKSKSPRFSQWLYIIQTQQSNELNVSNCNEYYSSTTLNAVHMTVLLTQRSSLAWCLGPTPRTTNLLSTTIHLVPVFPRLLSSFLVLVHKLLFLMCCNGIVGVGIYLWEAWRYWIYIKSIILYWIVNLICRDSVILCLTAKNGKSLPGSYNIFFI